MTAPLAGPERSNDLVEELQGINDRLNHAECERNANPCPGEHEVQRRGAGLPFVCA